MEQNSGQGEWIRRRFPSAVSAVVSTTAANDSCPPVSFSLLKTDAPFNLGDITPENAFTLHVNRAASAGISLLGRKQPLSHVIGARACSIYNLADLPMISVSTRYNVIRVFMPGNELERVAQDNPGLSICLAAPALSFQNDVLENLASTVESVFMAPTPPAQLFIDHLSLCIQLHLLHHYNERPLPEPSLRGGLPTWQLKRAQELMSDCLTDDISLAELAACCNLSTRHFSRAFRQSTGLAPFQWLAAKRVEVARQMVLQTRLPLHNVAIACGYADSSHLTRVFKKVFGVTPTEERRGIHRPWTENDGERFP